jgi:RNA polymerase sigma-70 factor (ECF subfamily)
VKGGKAMAGSLLRTDREITEVYERNCKTVYRVCFAFLKNAVDTEDAVQETFFRLIKSAAVFQSDEHEKAWLIKTATNISKNLLRHWWRRRQGLDGHDALLVDAGLEVDDVLGVVLSLPSKYKTVVYLYYYEGYNSVEIARILAKPQSTIRNHLHEARSLLKAKLGGDFDEG